MAENRPTFLSRFAPLISQLLLWSAFGALLVVSFWPPSEMSVEREFRLVGNRTNLYAVLAGRAAPESEEPDASRTHGQIAFAHMGPREKWAEPEHQEGNVAGAVAWQEDLVVFFADGGLYFVGPSELDYQPPPIKGVGAWRPVAAAADGERLLALGADAGGQPVFSTGGALGWGDTEAADLKVQWSEESARTAEAAMRDGEFHVVWTEPVAGETPIDRTAGERYLRFAYRDGGGRWHGPFEDRTIRTTGPLHVAPLGERLAMVYPERGEQGEAAQRRLAYAEFTPQDDRWHRVRRLPKLPASESSAEPLGWGFARFGGDHVLGMCRSDGSIALRRLDPETGELTSFADTEAPKLAVRLPSAAETREPFSGTYVLVAAGLGVLLFLALRALQRKAMRDRIAASDQPDREAARILADQMERIMYLPVLLRRGGAFLIDTILVLVPAAEVIGRIHPGLIEAMMTSEGQVRVGSEYAGLMALLSGLLVLYYVVMEGLWQRTLGKMVLRLTVVDLLGHRPSFWRVVVRNLLRPVDSFLFVGLVFILWTRRNQRLGDLAAGTRVVMLKRRGERRQPDNEDKPESEVGENP